MDVEPVAQIVSSLGVAGVLGWFLFYKTSIADPKRDEQTLNRIDAMQIRSELVINKICADFTQCLREEREVRREEIKTLRNDLKFHRDALEDIHKHEQTKHAD